MSNLSVEIDYFTLSFLVYADDAFVHDCDWNPHTAVTLREKSRDKWSSRLVSTILGG